MTPLHLYVLESDGFPEAKESNSLSLVDCSHLEENNLLLQVAVDQEIVTSANNDSISSSEMANTKETSHKEGNQQGSPARFSNQGKPGGKVGKHLAVASEDDNNNVQGTVRAGRRRRVWGRKARIYKRPAGIKRKYHLSIGALHEIRHYQRSTDSYVPRWLVPVYIEKFVRMLIRDNIGKQVP